MLCVAGGETYYPLIETHFITTRMRREVLSALVVHLIRKEKRWAISGGVAALVGAACLIPLIAETLNPPLRAAPIHDISTDTVNPPAFEVLDETRAGTSHTRERGGPVLAEAQAPAFPSMQRISAHWRLQKISGRTLWPQMRIAVGSRQPLALPLFLLCG